MDIHFCLIIAFSGISVMCLTENITVYSGQLGETLTIVCPYQQRANRWARKLWCKVDEVGLCEAVISAHRYELFGSKTRGNTTISDNASEGMFTVNITNLQKVDAGIYQCRTVNFGDITILQRIKVLVLEKSDQENVSDLDNVQHSISGSQSDSQLLMLFILGSSLILCKGLVMGMLYTWWKIQHTEKVKHESLHFLSAEQLWSIEDNSEETFNSNYTEEDIHYMNYVNRGHMGLPN